MALSEYNFTIVYRKGTANGNGDGMSRMNLPDSASEDDPESLSRVEESSTLLAFKEEGEGNTPYVVQVLKLVLRKPIVTAGLSQRIKTAQGENAVMTKCINLLKDGRPIEAMSILATDHDGQGAYIYRPKKVQELLLVDDLLCVTDSKGVSRIVIPKDAKEIKRELLLLAHDHAMAGHFGKSRTWARLAKHYYWPNLSVECKEYTRGCVDCKAHKDTKLVQIGVTPSLPQAPNHRVGIDLVGPLSCPDGTGFKYILVMIDYFTK